MKLSGLYTEGEKGLTNNKNSIKLQLKSPKITIFKTLAENKAGNVAESRPLVKGSSQVVQWKTFLPGQGITTQEMKPGKKNPSNWRMVTICQYRFTMSHQVHQINFIFIAVFGNMRMPVIGGLAHASIDKFCIMDPKK